MKIGKKVTGRALGIPSGLAIGGLISLIITLAGAATAAYLVVSGKIGEGNIGYAIMVIEAVAAVMGAWGAYSIVKRLRLQICMMSGGVYFLMLLGMTALFFGGRYRGIGVTFLVILISCIAVALFPGRNGIKLKKKKRVYR